MKPTSDIILGAIQFALNHRPTSIEIERRESSLYLESINAAVVDNPSSNPRNYEIKINFNYSPPTPKKEDLIVWIGFDRDDNYRFIEGKRD